MRLRHFAARKRKRGASLVMVLVSMTILTIMGTLFTTIAMRSYQYSYSRMCRQQAYYTATSSVESLYAKIKTNGSILNDITTALNDAYEDLNGEALGIDVTTIRVKIGSTHGDPVTEERAVVGSDFFYTYLGECDLWARYNNAKRTEISLEAEATYNGYSETARAIIAKTNRAASELKKIFDNTFCLQSPISTIVAETTHGDIYVSQPIADTDSAAVQNLVENKTISATDIKAYNTVFADLSENGASDSGYAGVPGQYLRYANGNIITSGDEGKYNTVLRYGVYGNAQASTSNASLVGHTKPLDMDNTPLKTSNDIKQPKASDLWYNDWVELYMFSAVDRGTAVNGDLYADSKILIGVLDRDANGVTYLRSWDNTIKRSVFSYNGDDPLDNYLNSLEYNNLTLDNKFEHGFADDVFFNHKTDPLEVDRSVFRLNGDMYLWEDARIENFDSKNVPKSEDENDDGKNSIYAYKNLYIDGMYIKTSWTTGATMPTTSNVVVGGDIVVRGNAQIMNATIYGDVYCYGDELTIVNCDIYGNVYFTGSNFTADYMRLFQTTDTEISTDGGTKIANINSAKGTYTNGIPDKGNLIINCATTDNLNVTGYDANAGFGTKDDVGYSDYDKKLSRETEYYRWGATLTNCWVLGTIWSNVNTHIMCSKWDDGTGHELPDYYGDIYVSKYLFIDLIWPYEIADQDLTAIGAGWDHKYNLSGMPTRQDGQISSYHANWHGFTQEEAKKLGYKDTLWGDSAQKKAQAAYDYFADALRFNCFEALDPNTQKIYAERFQFRLNQTDGLSAVQDSDVSHLGTLLVGGGGLYIDGNPEGHDEGGRKESTQFKNIYSMSSAGSIWECTVDGNASYNASADTVAGKLKSGTNNITTALSDLYKEMMPNGRETAIDDVKNDTFDKNGSVGKVWEDKLIKIRTWTAPRHSDDPGASTSVNYVGGETGIDYSTDASDVNGYLYHLSKNSAAGSVSGTPGNGDYTLTIKQSVCFKNRVDWSAFDRIVIDTSKGNVYIRFLNGVVLGKAGAKNYDEGAEVVLTGGSMVFWYLYESGSYDFDRPTLQVNPYTRLGLVSAETGSGYGYDGLYIISNDDSLITMGQNAVLNGFVYTPRGQVFIAPAESSYAALNGCMAIESLIMLSDPDEWTETFWDKLGGLFGDGAFGQWVTGGSEAIVDAIIKQYENIVFNYVQPPLIVDFNFSYGNTEGEISDFGQVVWEFLGYY